MALGGALGAGICLLLYGRLRWAGEPGGVSLGENGGELVGSGDDPAECGCIWKSAPKKPVKIRMKAE